MTQFGQGIPNLVDPGPARQGDLRASNALQQAGNALSSLLQAGETVVRASAQEQRAAQVLAKEIEQRKQIRARIDIRENQALYEQAKDIELFGMNELLASKTTDEVAAFYSKNPVFDPQNQKVLGDQLGLRLARQANERIYTKVAGMISRGENDSSMSAMSLVEEEMSRLPDGLPASVRNRFQQTVLAEATSYLKRKTSEELSIQQKNAEDEAEVNRRVHLKQSLDGEIPFDRGALLSSMKVDSRYANNDRAALDAVAFEIASFAESQLQPSSGRAPSDILDWLTAKLSGDDNRILREKVDALGDGLFQKARAAAMGAEASRISGTVESIRGSANDLAGADLMSGLNKLYTDIDSIDLPAGEKQGLKIFIEGQRREVRGRIGDTAMTKEVLAGRAKLSAQPSQAALDKVWDARVNEGADLGELVYTWVARGLDLPNGLTGALERHLGIDGDLNAAMTILRSAEQAETGLGSKLPRNVRLEADERAMAEQTWAVTRGLDPKSPEYQEAIAILGSREGRRAVLSTFKPTDPPGPNATLEETKQYQDQMDVLSPKLLRGAPETAAIKVAAEIAEATNLGDPGVVPIGLRDEWQSRFTMSFARQFVRQGAGANPVDISEKATISANNWVKQNYVPIPKSPGGLRGILTFGGATHLVPTDAFPGLGNAANEPNQKEMAARHAFRSMMSAMSDDGLEAQVQSPIMVDGQHLIPVIDATPGGVDEPVQGFLKWNSIDRSFDIISDPTAITRGPLAIHPSDASASDKAMFNAASKRMSDRALNPFAGLARIDGDPPSLEEKAIAGGQQALTDAERLVRFGNEIWEREYGTEFDRGDMEQAAAFDVILNDLAKQLGFDSFNAGEAGP